MLKFLLASPKIAATLDAKLKIRKGVERDPCGSDMINIFETMANDIYPGQKNNNSF